ncbi:MAG: hypothetical protein JO261_14510 [Alphaproteobacteria bacterium]|nr:hypothetical protein [Alphaproteobacteria bacterium]MBV9694907.1 hypothetical protein [Alphaproteobacteria bacterium]
MASYVVKAEIADARAKDFEFVRIKTMYGGKDIAVGDTVFVFASETQGGEGLVARGVVAAVAAARKPLGTVRWTPRVDVAIRRTALARRALGRDQLKGWRGTDDGSPQAELDFKFYRQATNKIGGISDAAAAFLDRCFR